MIPYSTFVNVKRWTKLRLFLRISRSSPFIVVCCDQCNPEDSCARTKPPVEHEFLLVNLSIQNSFWSRTSQRWTRFLCTLDPSPIRQNPWSDRTKRGRGSLWFPSNKISSYRRESRIIKHHFTIMMIISWGDHHSDNLRGFPRAPCVMRFLNLEDGCHPDFVVSSLSYVNHRS